MEKSFLIPIEATEEDFKSFLSVDNKRIFFSGRFGIGKTYFLKEFFKNHQNDFEVFHLFPINYQINSNEDIVALLKYDILVELLKKNQTIFQGNEIDGISGHLSLFFAFLKKKVSINSLLQSTIDSGSNLLELFPGDISSVIAKIGRPMKDLLNFDKELQTFKNEYEKGDKGKIEAYIEALNEKDISETDYLSYLLNTKIVEQKGTKQSVLVLDDIDRIDPEHIFRILNIFSAHFDGDGNKFGFDHVVIVGDVKNIENIFHHKYGPLTDFWGYFDKFFTLKPYILNNEKIIAEKIPQLVQQIQCKEPGLTNAMGRDGYIKLFLSEVLVRALDVEMLNLRQLYKPVNQSFPELRKGVYREGMFSDNFQQILDIGIKLLIAVFGGHKAVLIPVLEKIRDNIIITDPRSRMPYESYIASMIKTLIDVHPGQMNTWKGYYYNVPKDMSAHFTITGDKVQPARFFYDALIEYVTRSNYIKNSLSDYES